MYMPILGYYWFGTNTGITHPGINAMSVPHLKTVHEEKTLKGILALFIVNKGLWEKMKKNTVPITNGLIW